MSNKLNQNIEVIMNVNTIVVKEEKLNGFFPDHLLKYEEIVEIKHWYKNTSDKSILIHCIGCFNLEILNDS